MTPEVREPTYLVLTALAAGPLHGYAVIHEVETLSNERVRLRAGTLYATLDRLVGEGAVELDHEEVVDGRFRRYYRLTAQGASVLSEESERRLALSRVALRRLRLAGGTW